jgi:hypothetical protein
MQRPFIYPYAYSILILLFTIITAAIFILLLLLLFCYCCCYKTVTTDKTVASKSISRCSWTDNSSVKAYKYSSAPLVLNQ